MSNINKVILIGRLGTDPEVRYLPSGDAVTKCTLATSRKTQDKEYTEWHKLCFFKRQAETFGEYCRKGDLVYCEGELRTNEWRSKSGEKHYTTEIIVFTYRNMSPKQTNANYPQQNQQQQYQQPQQQYQQQQANYQQQSTQKKPPQQNQQQPPTLDFDDDIPFMRITNKQGLLI